MGKYSPWPRGRHRDTVGALEPRILQANVVSAPRERDVYGTALLLINQQGAESALLRRQLSSNEPATPMVPHAGCAFWALCERFQFNAL